MKILEVEQIREADKYTIEHEPVASIDLMERASGVFVKWFARKFSRKHPVKIFCGIGNNGGDGLAAGRLLSERGFEVSIFIVRFSNNASQDFRINEKRLQQYQNIRMIDINEGDPFPSTDQKDIIVDALWGSGLTRPIEGFAASLIEHLNDAGGTKVAIDIPSGLYADKHSDSVKFHADHTLSFELPKLSFLFPENHHTVGEWMVKSIGLHPSYLDAASTGNFFLTKNDIRAIIRKKGKFDHKGTNGHALIISGSYGKMGAAILAGKSCLKAGAGLLTMHIPGCGYEIIQTAFPEAMVEVDREVKFVSEINDIERYNAIGIGPGISTQKGTADMIHKLLKNSELPLVIDADGLNIISANKGWLNELPQNSILTPHPKEFERLFGKTDNSYDRHHLQKAMASKYNIHIVLKGAYTAIACPDGNTYYNATGNPGMATAGAGDVLTGIITGLMAQGYTPKSSCLLGVYLHGLAGDIAAGRLSEPSLIASDIIHHVDAAYRKIIN